MRRIVILPTWVVATGYFSSVPAGTAPLLFNYQGRLLDDGGNPITGSRVVTVRMFADSIAGLLLWEETHASVAITDGLFDLVVGSVSSMAPELFADPGDAPGMSHRFLEIQIDAGSTLSPRTRLISAPFAVSSYRVAGDIVTDSGSLLVPVPATGETGILLLAGTGGSILQLSGSISGGDLPMEEISMSVMPESPLGQGRSAMQ